MRLVRLLPLAVVLGACAPGIAARQPLAQQPIGTGVPGGPTATRPTTAPASASDDSPAPTPAAEPTSTTRTEKGASAADFCPPKGKKADYSRLAARSGCKGKTQGRGALITDLRSNEQLLASMQSNAPEREELVYRLAVGYAGLECAIASACAKGQLDPATSPEEVSITEAKKKTEEFCATMKSDFPKSKRQCP